jgi:hypothetical protein
MAAPRVTVDESLSVSRVTVADTAPRVVVSETSATTGISVTAAGTVVAVTLSPTAAGVASVNGLTGVVTVQEAVDASTTLAVPGALTAGTFSQGSTQAGGTFASYAENPVFYGYNLTLGGLDSGSNLQGITFAGAPSGGAFLGYNDATDKLVQSRDGVIYYDIPTSTSELAEGTRLYYTDARADARVSAGIASIDFPVDSVNGKTNTVVLTTSDIGEGTNQYYTTARVNAAFDTRLATKTTDNLAQGTTNKYFANGLARSAISVAGSLSYSAITGVISYTTPTTIESISNHTTTDLGEGTNLYYTDARFDSRLATKTSDNLSEGSTNKYYTDARARSAISVSGSLSYDSDTGVVSYTTPTTVASLSNHTTDALGEGTTNKYYTDARADARVAVGIAALVDTAPTTLDTLNELAAALGDDPNFAATITTALGTKLNTADFETTADSWLSGKSTTNLSEGTNLYYTDARVTSRINSTSIDALSDVVITSGTGGQMLYYTGTNWVNSAQVDSANLARFSRTNSGISSNTILAVSRNRTDGARATDSGPWLGFEYVGTDNTQATSPQTAIRSLYDPAGNHKLQVLQLPGTYNSPTVAGQIQRGGTFFNTTAGVSNLFLSDTTARIGGTVTSITNSANTQTYASFGSTLGSINQDSFTIKNNAGTTTYAQFLSTGHSITAAGLSTITRTTVGTPGATENRPSFNIQLTRSDQAAPANNDGTGFRYRVAGSNGTNYTIADMNTGYSTTGDVAWFLNLANGDQTGATFSSVNTIQSKVSATTIRAGTASATPGGSSVSDIAVFSAAKILNKRPHRSDVTTHTMARGSTYTPAVDVNNYIELTLTAGTDPTYIDVDNLTVANEGGHQAILVWNNSGSTVGNGDLVIRNNGVTINSTQDTIATGARVIFTVYCVGNYASCEYMTAG